MKAGLREFTLASMDALQNWFFWTWKVSLHLCVPIKALIVGPCRSEIHPRPTLFSLPLGLISWVSNKDGSLLIPAPQ